MQKFLDRISWSGKNRLIYTFGAMTLFFMLFEGMTSYILPITITDQGLSKTMLGIILAAAAVSGAFFDFAIYKIFKEAHYRRLFIVMFASAAFYLFLVWIANAFLLFLAAMAIWGFFYDLKSFGTIDFVSRYSKKNAVAGNFGIIQTFQAIGYLLAPLIAGFLIVDYLGWQPFAAAAVFLLIAAFFLAMLFFEARKSREFLPPHEHHSSKGFLHELFAWRKTGSALLPIFLLGSFATIIDSFYMALGPLVAESLPLEPFDGIFMFAYYLPPLAHRRAGGRNRLKVRGEEFRAFRAFGRRSHPLHIRIHLLLVCNNRRGFPFRVLHRPCHPACAKLVRARNTRCPEIEEGNTGAWGFCEQLRLHNRPDSGGRACGCFRHPCRLLRARRGGGGVCRGAVFDGEGEVGGGKPTFLGERGLKNRAFSLGVYSKCNSLRLNSLLGYFFITETGAVPVLYLKRASNLQSVKCMPTMEFGFVVQLMPEQGT